MREAQAGNKNPMWGKKLSKERRRQISECQKGKVISPEVRRKMSLGKMGQLGWNKGGHISEGVKQKIADAKRLTWAQHPEMKISQGIRMKAYWAARRAAKLASQPQLALGATA
jgi:hypothetical protein